MPFGPIETSLVDARADPAGARGRAPSRRGAARSAAGASCRSGRPSPADRARATPSAASASTRPIASSQPRTWRPCRCPPALERPPDVQVPQRQRLDRQVEPGREPEVGQRDALLERAQRGATCSPSSTPCASTSARRSASGPSATIRRTSADQPRSARSPPAPALVASSGVLDAGAQQPAERRRDERTRAPAVHSA